MMTVSQAALAAYVHAMMRAFAPAAPPGRRLAEWLYHNQCLVGVDFHAAMARAMPGGAPEEVDLEKPLPQAVWAELCDCVARSAAGSDAQMDSVAANIATFAAAVGLDPIETEIFRFVFYTDCEKAFDRLCGMMVGTHAVDTLGLTALCLGGSGAEIWGRLLRGPLHRLSLVGVNNDFGNRFTYYVPRRVVRALMPPSAGLPDIERCLIGMPLAPQLACADFDHVAAERDFVLRLLRGALAQRRRGVNVLLHGAPGTGKSEFCKMIGREIGCAVFAVGETDEEGGEPSRWERIDALRLGDQLAGGRGDTLLLFDEMEDILEDGQRASSHCGPVRRAGSKVFFNRLLEQNQVPVLWTANAIDEFDPAFLRRMTFAFEMKPMSVNGRARLWEGFAQRRGLILPAACAASLARRHRVSPALMTGAIDAVAMAGGAAEEIDFVVGALTRPMRGGASALSGTEAPFEPALANADLDLAHLQRSLVALGAAPDTPRQVSLCFYGPPGTGKSAFARQLAGAMGLETSVKRGSDLLSKWIGETERNLARAFDEARQDGLFLIIDEAEGFLWNRSGASRSWEVSMVNEMLVQMESHGLPFACTTNHLDCIDPAALRRFTFKVKFDFMKPQQIACAYRQFFAAEPPARLQSLQHLTPGDFAVIAKKRRLMAGMSGAEPDLVRLLEQEIEAKNLRSMKMGF